MKCPKCGHIQLNDDECESCGINFQGYLLSMLKKNLSHAIQLYNDGKYLESESFFNFVLKENKYNNDTINNESRIFLQKISEYKVKVDEISKNEELEDFYNQDGKNKTFTYENKYSLQKTNTIVQDVKHESNESEQFEYSKDNEMESSEMNTAGKFIIIKRLSVGSIVMLLFVSFYLHYDNQKKLKKIADIIAEATDSSVSKLADSTKSSFVNIARNVDNNTDRIVKIENKINAIIPILDNCNNHAHSHSSYSDERLKKDIDTIDSSLKNVILLQSYIFKYTDSHPELKFDKKLHYGYMAGEVEKIFPNIISIDEYGYKKVNYLEVIPILSEAIKEQNEIILKLKDDVEKMRSSINVERASGISK